MHHPNHLYLEDVCFLGMGGHVYIFKPQGEKRKRKLVAAIILKYCLIFQYYFSYFIILLKMNISYKNDYMVHQE